MDVQDTLLLNQQLTIVYSKVFQENLQNPEEINNFGQFFIILSECLNFIDCDILESVIEEHGSTELQSQMTSYCQDLKAFRQSTTVDQLLRLWIPKNSKPIYRPQLIPKGYKDYVVKLKQNPKTCTLEELESLRNDTSRSIQDAPLLTAAIILHEVTSGSVIAVWRVKEDVVELLSAALSRLVESCNSSFIQRYKIKIMLLDDYILFSRNSMEQVFMICSGLGSTLNPIDSYYTVYYMYAYNSVQQFWNFCRAGNLSGAEGYLQDAECGNPNYVCKVRYTWR